jgi:DNA-binding FadR family transcriptional regulator
VIRKTMQSDFAVDKVERELLHGILTGRYRANDCLPSIDRLCASFGVAYQTVRSAVGRLVARGLLVAVAGEAKRVVELQSSMDLKLLLEVIDEAKDEPLRRWNLIAQTCGFLRFILNEIADRAARNRDDEQLEWLRHLIRLLTDRVAMKTSRREVGDCELQLARVLAAASGCVAHTALINSMRAFFVSDLLMSGPDPLMKIEEYWALAEALANRDAMRAREIIDDAWWRLEEHCIEELKKLGWTETPTGATPGAP